MTGVPLRALAQPVAPDSCIRAAELGSGEVAEGLRSQREQAFKQCDQILLNRCFSDLKPVISEDELTKIYAELRSNRLLHQANPNGDCAKRAYVINKILAERGYGSERLQIQAPVIIGKIFDDRGKLVSAYNYNYHVVPVVQVRARSGAVKPMILDPEFVPTPLPQDEYLQSVTGQSCQEVAEEVDRIGLGCTFTRRPLNHRFEFSEKMGPNALEKLVGACGWSSGEQFERDLTKALKKNGDRPEPLPFAVDPKLGPDRSAFKWALDKLKGRLEKNVALYRERLAQLEVRPTEGESQRYFQTERSPGGKITVTEIPPAKAAQWRERLRLIEQDLSGFPGLMGRVFGDHSGN